MHVIGRLSVLGFRPRRAVAGAGPGALPSLSMPLPAAATGSAGAAPHGHHSGAQGWIKENACFPIGFLHYAFLLSKGKLHSNFRKITQ